jgi:hypothetical protein
MIRKQQQWLALPASVSIVAFVLAIFYCRDRIGTKPCPCKTQKII